MVHCKAGTTELTREEAQKIYNNNLYIINYLGVYHLCYSEAQNSYYAHKDIIIKGLSKRGRYHTMNSTETNSLLKRAGCTIQVY